MRRRFFCASTFTNACEENLHLSNPYRRSIPIFYSLEVTLQQMNFMKLIGVSTA